jgi:type IV pilus assembly protein PilB
VSTSGKRRRLGELLIEAGVLDPSQLDAALTEQKKWGGKLGRTVVEMGFVDEDSMMRALSRQLNLPAVDLDTAKLPPTVTQLLGVDICERYGVFPLGADLKAGTLQLATSDPTSVEAQRDITFKTGLKVQAAVATGSGIDRAIRRLYYGEQKVARSSAPRKKFAPPPLAYEPPPPTWRPMPAVAPDPLAEIDAAARNAELVRLTERLNALEKQNASQARALRALVELLIESGVVARQAYLAKARGQ